MMSDFELDNFLINSSKREYQKPSKIIFTKGTNNIEQNVIYDSKNITLEAGSKICINKNKLLHIKNSKIRFAGTSNEPNIFSGCDEIGGSLLIENSLIKVGVAEFSNLNYPKKKLRSLYGGLNIINSNLIGDRIIVKNSLSEDAINFINSDIKLNNLSFKNIKSDALDSDYSKLNIDNIKCEIIGNDCVDLSYSNGKIKFINGSKIKDKVISLGEKSFLDVDEVKAFDSDIGIVSKDLSTLNIEKYTHKNVVLPISAYVKKPELGIPTIKIKNLSPMKIDLDLISNDSIIYINNQKIKGNKSSNQVSKMLYGNLYGVKTIR